MLDAKQPRIIAYLKPQCGWSRGVRAILQKYNLQYEDRDILASPDHYAEMVQKSGQTLQPTLEIGGRILADASGAELEQWLIREGIVTRSDAPPGAPTHAACSIEERGGRRASAEPI